MGILKGMLDVHEGDIFGLGLWNRDLTEYTLGSFECPQRCIGFVLYISVIDLLSNICEKSKELIRNQILGNKHE